MKSKRNVFWIKKKIAEQVWFLPLTDIFFKMVWQIELEAYMVESPKLKRPSHAPCFDILKNSHFYKKNCLCIFHDAIFGHTFININKQLSWNVLQYNPVFTIHIKCLSNLNYSYKYSIIYILQPQEIRSL